MRRYLPAGIFAGICVVALVLVVVPTASGPDECGVSDYRDLPPCDVDSHPPDIKVFNHDDETRSITVTVTDTRRSEVLVSRRISGNDRTTRLEDVVTEPGSYLVEAETDGGSSDSYRWEVDEHVPTGGQVITVAVLKGGTVTIERTSYP